MAQAPSQAPLTVVPDVDPSLKKNSRVLPPEVFGGPGQASEEEGTSKEEEGFTWWQVRSRVCTVESLDGYYLKADDFEALYADALDGFNGPESYFTDFYKESPSGDWVIQDIVPLEEMMKDYGVDLTE